MHEFSIVERVLELALQIAYENGEMPVTRVRLEIGALRQVVPEALSFAFEAATKDTLAEGAELEWKEIPVEAICEACGTRFKPEELFWACSLCSEPGGRVVAGDDIVLTSIELEDAAPRGEKGRPCKST